MTKEKSIFDIFTTVLNGKDVTPEEIAKIPSYVFCTWLSGSPYTILAANEINKYSDMPVENQYYMIKNAYQNKIKFIRYPKGAKSQTELKEIEYIQKYFKINQQQALDYYNLISKDELSKIQSAYERLENR